MRFDWYAMVSEYCEKVALVGESRDSNDTFRAKVMDRVVVPNDAEGQQWARIWGKVPGNLHQHPARPVLHLPDVWRWFIRRKMADLGYSGAPWSINTINRSYCEYPREDGRTPRARHHGSPMSCDCVDSLLIHASLRLIAFHCQRSVCTNKVRVADNIAGLIRHLHRAISI